VAVTDTPPLADEEDLFTVAPCAASRQIAAGFALDQTVPHDELGQVSLRFIYVNIIAEYARHAGHADIIREQIDGVTGDSA